MEMQDLLKLLPQVDEVLKNAQFDSMRDVIPGKVLTHAVRNATDKIRKGIIAGNIAEGSREEFIQSIVEWTMNEVCSGEESADGQGLRNVINATGIVLHTNLGRSLLCKRAVEKMEKIATGYSNLEYNIEEGKRGSRHSHIEDILREITGAESAMVVNNNAAATLLALSAVAEGKEVVTSRGELVEIGGSFRVPEIIQQGGAVLKEVGTTNRTRIRDYIKAFRKDRTAAFLKVHRSNYKIVGFTEEASMKEIAEEAHKLGIPAIYDLGSGNMVDLSRWGINEPSIPTLVAEGVDLILFSGDKMLGGPQAGIAIGKKDLIDKMKQHPLARALRVDKITIAALYATLLEYRDSKNALEKIPALSMISAPEEELRQRAENLAKAISASTEIKASAVLSDDLVGGGSDPTHVIKGWAVRLEHPKMNSKELEEKLRLSKPSVISVIVDNYVTICMRTIRTEEEKTIEKLLVGIK